MYLMSNVYLVILTKIFAEIPFKPKRKTSAPIVQTIEQEEVDQIKLQFFSKRDVSKSTFTCHVLCCGSYIVLQDSLVKT